MKRSDLVIRVGGSLIQHGHLNDRIYLMRLDPADTDLVLDWIEDTRLKEGYSKVFAKVPSGSAAAFLNAGFRIEAEIPGYFPDGSACLFLGKYTRSSRRSIAESRVAEILGVAEERAGKGHPLLKKGYSIREALVSDSDVLAGIYASVFPSYPFPIDDPDFISDSIADGKTRFFMLCKGDHLIAASSAELDPLSKTVEMTDFATLPSARGTGAAGALLDQMERVVRDDDYHLAYTICRAEEPPVNILFSRGGYRYAGTLPNNTQISGGFESMNVWYKPLLRSPSSY